MTRPVTALDAVDATPGDVIPRVEPFIEQGRSGLKRTSGYVDNEFLPALKGRKGVQAFREMSDNSPVIGAFLTAVYLLLRQNEWRVEPANSGAKAKKKADFLEECQQDMETSWGDVVMECATMVPYGWHLAEPVYKKRLGPQNDPRKSSQYNDGRIGWRKIAGRSQDTLLRWVFTPEGDIEAMVQMAPPTYEKRVLGLNKCILFRTSTVRNNPEGRSWIRSAYVPYVMVKRLMEIEAVGIERDLAGVPVAKVPSKLFTAAKGSPDWQTLQRMRQLVTGLRRNEQEGVLWPYDVDELTKLPEYELELMTSGGSRQFDISGIIERYETRILMSLLADFMMVGHEDNGGSYALHTDKSGLFRTAINGVCDAIADAFNRQEIPRLFRLNADDLSDLPKIVPNKIDPPNLAELSAFMTATAGLGMQWFPDPVMEKFVRDAAQVPQLDPNIEKVLEIEHQQAAVMALAQQNLELLQVQQQAAQGEAQMQQAQLGVAQQADAALNPPEPGADPGDPDGANAQAQAGESTNQAKLATQASKVKVDQEKAKLANLKQAGAAKKAAAKAPAKVAAKVPAKAAAGKSKGRQPVKKSHANGFGISHDYSRRSA